MSEAKSGSPAGSVACRCKRCKNRIWMGEWREHWHECIRLHRDVTAEMALGVTPEECPLPPKK